MTSLSKREESRGKRTLKERGEALKATSSSKHHWAVQSGGLGRKKSQEKKTLFGDHSGDGKKDQWGGGKRHHRKTGNCVRVLFCTTSLEKL